MMMPPSFTNIVGLAVILLLLLLLLMPMACCENAANLDIKENQKRHRTTSYKLRTDPLDLGATRLVERHNIGAGTYSAVVKNARGDDVASIVHTIQPGQGRSGKRWHTVLKQSENKRWEVGHSRRVYNSTQTRAMLDLYLWIKGLEQIKTPRWLVAPSPPVPPESSSESLGCLGNFCWCTNDADACNTLAAACIGAGCEFYPTHSNQQGQPIGAVCVCG